MLSRLESSLDGRGLELNAGKPKVMRLRRGERRMKKIDLRWKGRN